MERRDYASNRFKMVHPYFDNPDLHLKYSDKEKTVFDMPNCSKEGQFTIKMFHWNETWAYNQRVANSRTKDLPMDVLKLVKEIVTYK